MCKECLNIPEKERGEWAAGGRFTDSLSCDIWAEPWKFQWQVKMEQVKGSKRNAVVEMTGNDEWHWLCVGNKVKWIKNNSQVSE